MEPAKTKEIKDEKTKTLAHGQRGCISDKCIHVSAWVFLTIGLCILVTTFYLAISKQQYNDSEASSVTADSRSDEEDELYSSEINNDIDIKVFFNRTLTHEVSTDASNIGYTETYENKTSGCAENLCKVECVKADDIYQALYTALISSNCTTADLFFIRYQVFPKNILKNLWIETSQSVREILIMQSNVTKIKNGAFNSPLFSKTFLLSIKKLYSLTKVESGALLGLYSLKYLIIDTAIISLDRALFQPVQTTLTYLKLNAGLNIEKNQNICGVSKLTALQYLDLSYNYFNGSISKEMFTDMTNLKFLIITYSRVDSLESDAFSALAGQLFSLNLSNNYIKTISGELLTELLTANTHFVVNLAMNRWVCDCGIQPLRNVYTSYRTRFLEPIFCRSPYNWYGTFIDEVDPQVISCDTTTEPYNSKSDDVLWTSSTTTTALTYPNAIDGSSPSDTFEDDKVKDAVIESGDSSAVFEMRCLNVLSSEDSEKTRVRSISFSATKKQDFDENNGAEVMNSDSGSDMILTMQASNDVPLMLDQSFIADTISLDTDTGYNKMDLEYFQFDPPSYNFELTLLDNNSVMIIVEDYPENPSEVPINILWFSDPWETVDANDNMSCSCVGYVNPFLIIDSLEENTTYTFCLMPQSQSTITPFNCLPLHVPQTVAQEDNVWISQENKKFTVGMMCLIFLLSVFFGAVVAYFGIKSHPDLLEGSKNVVVVKKSDKTCYVSTIFESGCLKDSQALSKVNSFKYPLPEKPTSGMPIQPPPPPPMSVNAKNLERLSSMKSSSTCFEDAFPMPIIIAEDEYELPQAYEKNHCCEERCVPNTYAMSPCSPPPLPQRNSAVFDNISLVPNRFGK